ncbi:hypothetical protein HY837_06120 [archaeon]|nr:hypothetical protein [archaeon]
MKIAHFIELSVFAKPEENVDALKQGLTDLIPFNLEEERIELQEQDASSFEGRTIKIFTINLTKEKHTNKFLNFLIENLSEHMKQTIKTQLDSRIDEELHFYLRFDKTKWVTEKKLFLTDGGDCYHIKITAAAFPKSRENAIKIIKNFLV